MNLPVFPKHCLILCIPVMLTPNSSDCDSAALEVLTHPFQ